MSGPTYGIKFKMAHISAITKASLIPKISNVKV